MEQLEREVGQETEPGTVRTVDWSDPETTSEEIIETIVDLRNRAKNAKPKKFLVTESEMANLLAQSDDPEWRKSVERNYIMYDPLEEDDDISHLIGRYHFDNPKPPMNRADRRSRQFGKKKR